MHHEDINPYGWVDQEERQVDEIADLMRAMRINLGSLIEQILRRPAFVQLTLTEILLKLPEAFRGEMLDYLVEQQRPE